MKRILLLLSIVLLTACQSEPVDNTSTSEPVEQATNEVTEQVDQEILIDPADFSDNTFTHYDIDVTLDADQHKLSAVQRVSYTHNIGSEDLYFHVYPNAFGQDTHPSLFDTKKDEISDEIGYLVFDSIQVNGQEISFSYEPLNTVVRLEYAFEKGQDYDIDMVYEVGVSPTSERFGVVNDIYNLGNWYPVMAVYDEDGWNLDPYLFIGDPFYSHIADYDVDVTVPRDFVVAGSGYIAEILDGSQKTYRFKTENMRDFALAISKEFLTMTDTVGDTEVIMYYPKKLENHIWLDNALSYGVNTIDLYEALIGDYPYKSYSIVITNFPSGMEYPGLVLISDNYFHNSIDRLRTVIVHETVHQWFYGIIGDDEIDEGWIDEGLTTYFTAFYDLKFDNDAYYNGTMKHYEDRVNAFSELIINRSAYEFDNWDDYGAAAYSKPALMYGALYDTYGEDKLIEFTKYLYEHYKFGILKEEGLRDALQVIYGEEIQEFLTNWLE